MSEPWASAVGCRCHDKLLGSALWALGWALALGWLSTRLHHEGPGLPLFCCLLDLDRPCPRWRWRRAGAGGLHDLHGVSLRHHVDHRRRLGPPHMLVQEVHHLLLAEPLLLHVGSEVGAVCVDQVHHLIVDVRILMDGLGVVHHRLVDVVVNNPLRLGQLREAVPVLHLHITQTVQGRLCYLRLLRGLCLGVGQPLHLCSGLQLDPGQMGCMHPGHIGHVCREGAGLLPLCVHGLVDVGHVRHRDVLLAGLSLDVSLLSLHHASRGLLLVHELLHSPELGDLWAIPHMNVPSVRQLQLVILADHLLGFLEGHVLVHPCNKSFVISFLHLLRAEFNFWSREARKVFRTPGDSLSILLCIISFSPRI